MILPDEKMQRQWPNIIMENKPLFNRYCRAAHSTGLTITNMIAEKLDVEPEEINSRHVIEEHAGDHVRMTRSPTRATEMPSIQTPSHTDFGTYLIHSTCAFTVLDR